MLDWKTEKANLRKQVKAHQKKHLLYMKLILKEKKLNGIVVKKNDGKQGMIRPEVKAHPNVYEPYEFVFFPFGINGDTIDCEGIPIEEKDLTRLFDKAKRSKR